MAKSTLLVIILCEQRSFPGKGFDLNQFANEPIFSPNALVIPLKKPTESVSSQYIEQVHLATKDRITADFEMFDETAQVFVVFLRIYGDRRGRIHRFTCGTHNIVWGAS
jgi:hypothetical protein